MVFHVETTEIPPGAVHVVADVPCCAASQVPQVCMVQTMPVYCGGSAVSSGLPFLGRAHRYTARVLPPSGRGMGGGDAGSLLPGVLPPN